MLKLVPADLGRPDIRSASSLLNIHNRIFLCCDDDYDLFELQSNHNWIQHKWSHSPQLPKNNEERKKLKPDFEALLSISNDMDKIWLIPSGSKPNRIMALEFNLITNQLSPVLLTDLFYNFSKELAQVNIEGAACYKDSIYFLNRGVGTDLSSLIILDAKNLKIKSITKIDFGIMEGLSLHGSELCIFEDKLFVVAVAEATENSYDDGEILGSALFQVCINTFKVLNNWTFNLPVKIEGICRFQDKWLVTTDPDGKGQSEFFTFTL